MLIKVKKNSQLSENLITNEADYVNRPRRQLIQKAALLSASLPLTQGLHFLANSAFAKTTPAESKLSVRKTNYDVKDSDRSLTEEKLALTYNNFYEFSLDKEEVSKKVEKWNTERTTQPRPLLASMDTFKRP